MAKIPITFQDFELKSDYKPAGSQPEAIKQINENFKKGSSNQTLLGVTGSGKTFTMAHTIKNLGKPTLVLAHNKTLAAQLYEELREFFPNNKVEYFVSYYDYYQPESYLPQKDQYIEKDSQINQKIERMRMSTTASLMSRNDVIVVSSVSCIYGLGNPEYYETLSFELKKDEKTTRNKLIKKLVNVQYERNQTELMPGRFKVIGDTIDVIPSYYENIIRIELNGDKIERITEIDKVTGDTIQSHKHFYIFPAKQYVIPESAIENAFEEIKEQLEIDIKGLGPFEAHRLKQRTLYDLEMIEETGYCKGIENYSRHFDRRKQGEKPFCLLDYFPQDFLLIIDESHQTIPQINGMYKGDLARKTNLIDFGFRLSSAYDNRPLKYAEFEKYFEKNKTLFVSATPGDYEKEMSSNVVEQLIRPTGLIDPLVEIKPIKNQMDSVFEEIGKTILRGDRILLTTLTKKLAEELTEYLSSKGIKTRYMHSEIETLERTEIIRELRLGKFDVLVGINLLREGLDIPEVGFVGILDADKEGFLRNDKSLIQTIGRAARNINAKVIMYADVMTDSINRALSETSRRREIQIAYNEENNITPQTIKKPIKEKEVEIKDVMHIPSAEIPNLIIELNADMEEAAEKLEFEKAIKLREKIKRLSEKIKN